MEEKDYLGKFDVDIQQTHFAKYQTVDWILYFIEEYGWISGDHHKTWLLDQIARLICGTSVIVKEHRWKNGKNQYIISLDEPTEIYHRWVQTRKSGPDGPETYSYDLGIAP